MRDREPAFPGGTASKAFAVTVKQFGCLHGFGIKYG